MPRYVDGFVIPIPKRNLTKYRRIARRAGMMTNKGQPIDMRRMTYGGFRTIVDLQEP